ncbi:hypothetical protein EIP86_001588 [Pleurotus ostreatoroseus]|nr:hypothetical protein EIP86_001588 [Pleurotus ostreatoroseus]
MRALHHPLNSEWIRHTISLGDQCGLTKEGIHFNRADPNTITCASHYHCADDEWYYILDAGEDGATLMTLTEGEDKVKEEKVYKGDFLGFPGGKRVAHTLKSGSQELVYLVGGTRQPIDICVYPQDGKRLVTDKTSPDFWFVEEKDVKPMTLGK